MFAFANGDDDGQEPEKKDVKINTKSHSIQIGKDVIYELDWKELKKILGKPNRVLADTSRERYEEHGFGDTPSTSTMIQVINYYYIYDDLGLMFYTRNGKSNRKAPEFMSVHFDNERIFSNTKDLPYAPKNAFTSQLIINDQVFKSHQKQLPNGVDYNTEEFDMYKTSFGPTSIGGTIDRLYSIDANPYMMFYLDSKKSQKISRLEIRILPNSDE